MKREEIAKALNKAITGEKFENKNINEYIYASLSQPPIKIIDKKNSDDELDYIVECPNCKSHVCYGTDIFMLSGHLYCSNKGCREKLRRNNIMEKAKIIKLDELIKQEIKDNFTNNLMETLNSAFIFKYVDTLEEQNKKQKKVINKAIEYVKENIYSYYDNKGEKCIEETIFERNANPKELLDILNEVSE